MCYEGGLSLIANGHASPPSMLGNATYMDFYRQAGYCQEQVAGIAAHFADYAVFGDFPAQFVDVGEVDDANGAYGALRNYSDSNPRASAVASYNARG